MKEKTAAKSTGKNTTKEKGNKSFTILGFSNCLRSSGGFFMPAIRLIPVVLPSIHQ
jgi:hypothetical protein